MRGMGRSERDRKLEEAAARSPEVAAMLAGMHDDPSGRYRRLGLLVAGAAVALGLLWVSVVSVRGRSAAPEKRHEPAQEIDTSHYLAPIKTEAAGNGEETAPFSGFAISVDTEPPGGIVTIAGIPRGEAPVLAGLECAPGAKLEVRAEKAGFPPTRVQTTCRADTLVKLTVRLAR
jgi:PEGA domain